MEPLQFQSIFKIVMVTQSIPGLVGLISPKLDWLLIRWSLPIIENMPLIEIRKGENWRNFQLNDLKIFLLAQLAYVP